MAGNGIRANLPILAIFLLSGSVLAAGRDTKIPVVNRSADPQRLIAGLSLETKSIRISSLAMDRPSRLAETIASTGESPA